MFMSLVTELSQHDNQPKSPSATHEDLYHHLVVTVASVENLGLLARGRPES